MSGGPSGLFQASGWGWAGPLAALAGAGVILLLYLLRRQPQRLVVPSTLLWQHVLRDAVARRPWQRFRSRLSLWLELLVALALALALARPMLPGGEPVLAGTVWVLDATASMGAGDRWQEALAVIRDDLEQAGPGFRGALLRAGPRPQWIAGPGATAAEIVRALDRLAGGSGASLVAPPGPGEGTSTGSSRWLPPGPSGGTTDWPAVLALAYGAAGALPPGSPVRVVTDGTDPALAEQLASPPPGPHPLEMVTLGEPVENTAILAVSPPEPAGDAAGPASRPAHGSPAPARITVTLIHYGREPASVTVVVDPARGGPAAVREEPPQRVTLEPGRPAQVSFTVPGGAPLYRVALVPGDAYPADDVAWSVPRTDSSLHVGLLAAGEAGLIHRALALRPGVQVSRLAGGSPEGTLPPGGSLENTQPRPTSPGGNAAGGHPSGVDAAVGTAPGEPLPGQVLADLDLLVVAGLPLPSGLPATVPVIWIDPPAEAGPGRTVSPGATHETLGASFQPRSIAVAANGEAQRLLHLVPLDGVTLLAARPLTLQPGEVPLLLGDGRPIATYRPPAPGRGGRVVLGFDPYQGTLLLRPAWPLLVQSLVDHLAPGGLGAPPEMVAGQALHLAPSPWLADVTVFSPSGQVVPPGALLDEPGLYRVTARSVARRAAEQEASGGPGPGPRDTGTVETGVWVRPHPLESAAVARAAPVPARGAGEAAEGPGGEMTTGGPSAPSVPAPGAVPRGTEHPGWRWAAWLALAALVAGTWVVRHEL